jgi:isopropanol dehydrogenase (NADP+)
LGKVIGHEAVGTVEQVGDLAKYFKPGDRVVLPAGVADSRHPRAQRGEAKYHQSNSPYFSDDPRMAARSPRWSRRSMLTSILPASRIPLRDIQAVMVDDMVATGFTGVERMEIQFGDVVVVIGIGPGGR